MKLLVHGCCADCTLKFTESVKISDDSYDFTIYYYNPNIHPRSEYQSRVKAIKQVCEDKKISLVLPDWKPSEYFSVIDNNQKPERCEKCWVLRLENTARYAKNNKFTHFSSTLLTSPYQNTEKVRVIGLQIAQKYGLEFYVPKNTIKELDTSGFYKQFFCGCTFSLTERMIEKFKK